MTKYLHPWADLAFAVVTMAHFGWGVPGNKGVAVFAGVMGVIYLTHVIRGFKKT
jgi:hypothetical protein